MVAEHADYSVEQELVQFGEGSLTFLEIVLGVSSNLFSQR